MKKYTILIPIYNDRESLTKLIENINEVVDSNSKWAKGYNGLLQYLCLKIICEKLKDD